MNKKIILFVISILFITFGIVLVFISYNKYVTVSYIVDGKTISSYKVRVNDIIDVPDSPSLDGYVFKGWYYKNKRFDFTEPVDKDIVLEAKWEKIIEDVNTGDNLEDKDYKSSIKNKDKSFGKDSNKVNNNYSSKDSNSFVNNSSDSNSNNKSNNKSNIFYNVSFVVDNKVVKTSKALKGSNISFPDVPVKSGYTFKGWYVGNKKISSNYKVNKNTKVIGVWDSYTYLIELIDGDDRSVNRKVNVYKNGKVIVAKAIYGNYGGYKDYKLGVWSDSLNALKIASNAQFMKSTNIKVELSNGLVVKVYEK